MFCGPELEKMHCDSCSKQFRVFNWKRTCFECGRYYCSTCLRPGAGGTCAACRLLCTRPLLPRNIEHLKPRDLQCFLQRQNVSTRGCVEKQELIILCVEHVNGSTYRRRGARPGTSPFSSLKGLTNNLNKFFNSALDRATPAPPPNNRNCYNSAHAHAHSHSSPAGNVPPAAPPQPERFTTTPGGEAQIDVPVPEARASVSRSTSAESARVDTADCYEIEDLDDSGWELVNTPADPLPNDSDVLLSAAEIAAARRERSQSAESATEQPTERHHSEPAAERNASLLGASLRSQGLGAELRQDAEMGAALASQRAASEMELRRPPSTSEAEPDSTSLHDELLATRSPGHGGKPRRINLEQLKSAAELEALSVRQLKELLARNKVEFRGCLERRDLLERARTLWHDHATFTADVDTLPIEECCKICMAAPLECVLLECGHIATCAACSVCLADCPICRSYIVRAVRFFRS